MLCTLACMYVNIANHGYMLLLLLLLQAGAVWLRVFPQGAAAVVAAAAAAAAALSAYHTMLLHLCRVQLQLQPAAECNVLSESRGY
jgi:hypothetical protein